jgi:hypothetical protein
MVIGVFNLVQYIRLINDPLGQAYRNYFPYFRILPME